MSTPQWDETVDAWTVELSTKAFGALEVLIRTDGSSSPPTPRQLSVLSVMANLPKSRLADLPGQMQAYAEEMLMEDELDDLSDSDFEIEFSMAMIPRLRDAADHYWFVTGHSDIDEEHGIACLFRNQDACRICHSDYAHENFDWDATDELDDILSS